MKRRDFLYGLALVGVTTACVDNSGDEATESRGDGGDRVAPGVETVVPAEPSGGPLAESIFSLGVASGDATNDAVILWTRLAADPVADNGGSPGDRPVEVAFDVAHDEAFEDLVVSDIATAAPELAHSVHVDVTGLDAGHWYYYRFRAGGRTSPVGRTRTMPAADDDVSQFRFVFASCQDLQWGRYAAWRHAVNEEDLDAVVFLGDYIYEITLGDLSPDKDGSRVWANDEPFDLAAYRVRWAQTKADPLLAAAHAAVPWFVTWDDHEVSNNYAGDIGQADITEPNSGARRLAAYQAWYEHNPVRLTPVPDGTSAEEFERLDIHRSFRVGDLMSLLMIETRQNADVPACRTDGGLLSDDGPACAATSDEARTNLGGDQERWLIDQLGESSTTWNVIANPIMFAGMNTGTVAEPAFSRDAWDGYPAVRQRVLDAIAESEVSNPVIVTGDWHASFVLDVPARPGLPTDHDATEPALTEFVVTSISSVLFSADYREANPHIRYSNSENGYAVVTVTPEHLDCTFRYIADVWDEQSALSRSDTWRVAAGERTAVELDPEPVPS